MFKVFNMGIGFILVVRPEAAHKIIVRAEQLGERCLTIGWLDAAPAKTDPPQALFVEREI